MSFETQISLPTRDLQQLTTLLRKAGWAILDSGDRTTPEDGVGAEATVHVAFFGEPTVEVAEQCGVTA